MIRSLRHHAFGALGALVLPCAVGAQQAADTTLRLTVGGFVDAYYAFDLGRPATFDRGYTTQAARHNEFNVNLAYLDATIAAPHARGRLSLQAGTSVHANYAGEPATGGYSGPSLSRHLQEAYAGVRLTPSLWVDGGVFYSHLGMESWASRDNPTYTRSLVAEYSPYYSSGVRATWRPGPALTLRVDLVNGWQNISETNQDKAGGVRLDWLPVAGTTASYYGFVSGETGGRLRLFNGIGIRSDVTARLQLLGEVDVGRQELDAEGNAAASWFGLTAVARLRPTPTTAVAARYERYGDEDEVLVRTGTGLGFRVDGASLGFDWTPGSQVMWRTEVRMLFADGRVFVDRDAATGLARRNTLAVSSLSVSF